MAQLNVTIDRLSLTNPVMTASGTFGYGFEFDDFIDVNALGGIVVKATTEEHREGNKYPRMAETSHGMLNTVGLQNKGIAYFRNAIYPALKKYTTKVIANVSGSKIDSYVAVAEIMNELDHISAIELNISCPNVKEGGMAFGTRCSSAAEVTKAVRKVYAKTLIVKLSPNVTTIEDIALAVEDSGADAVSLINTLLGMAIDVNSRKPKLSTITGGLSGPAIKPVALRMVWQVARTVKIPVIGIGGIASASDAIEFLLAGASAVQVGTANFINPGITIEIIEGINQYLDIQGFTSVNDCIGALITE
ncbi:MAG: dihydroorotate dehydrogenase [Bacteroidales bacterium]|nr:dihydroorotate dehydrogenase [Bacteroidales bacterium]MDD2322914.1 dihydroorotate dehydrogenase [Bacteroidales bacterium]MDD3010226.1 dihydroorotate dehydrogenase [Bacteroidales bacterium]MDD3962421.1 dihydroorotate dehydrogenase [Bacteroidales bacterium]MDY0285828.1 dihydroorotate dehydrogenase [Bacteroidales bacterium]